MSAMRLLERGRYSEPRVSFEDDSFRTDEPKFVEHEPIPARLERERAWGVRTLRHVSSSDFIRCRTNLVTRDERRRVLLLLGLDGHGGHERKSPADVPVAVI